jgi:hypothetical protein
VHANSFFCKNAATAAIKTQFINCSVAISRATVEKFLADAFRLLSE